MRRAGRFLMTRTAGFEQRCPPGGGEPRGGGIVREKEREREREREREGIGGLWMWTPLIPICRQEHRHGWRHRGGGGVTGDRSPQ